MPLCDPANGFVAGGSRVPSAVTALLALALVLFTAGCCVPRTYTGARGSATRPSPDLEMSEEDRNRQNPVRDLERSVEAGGLLFNRMCVPCHGEKGNGRGKLARQLGLRPPNFRCESEQRRRTDGELFHILTYGHRGMPGQGHRWDDEVKWDLVNYIRSLRRGWTPSPS